MEPELNPKTHNLALETRPKTLGRPDATISVRHSSYLSGSKAQRRGSALAWISLGLGLAQIVAPKHVARWIGLANTRSTRLAVRAIGLREIGCAIGLFTNPRSSSWASARVAGDIMDIALLARALGSNARVPKRTAIAASGVLAVGLLDADSARKLKGPRAAGIDVTRTITLQRTPEEVYRFWRDFENLPRFMDHLKTVHVVDGRSHWSARGPLGTSIEWDAEIVEDRPNELISWRSVPGADVQNQGSVQFRGAPGGRGTEIVVTLRYEPPAGMLGAAVAKLFGEEPGQQVAGDLRRFKQVMETGEVMASDASVHRGMHAARPSRRMENQAKRVSK
jgi:uncharacterized membrane protein